LINFEESISFPFVISISRHISPVTRYAVWSPWHFISWRDISKHTIVTQRSSSSTVFMQLCTNDMLWSGHSHSHSAVFYVDWKISICWWIVML